MSRIGNKAIAVPSGVELKLNDGTLSVKGPKGELSETLPPEIDVTTIYRGVVPFILLQLLGLAIIFNWKDLVTWLPSQAYG